MTETPTRILFVCMGNICRSPTAEGVFRKMLADKEQSGFVETDSCGTHAYHVGKAPDPRSQAAAQERGVDISDLRARQVELSDFEYFDYILAMDQQNLEILLAEVSTAHRDKVRLFLEFANDVSEIEVPDPYYGGGRGFEHVLDLIENASAGLINHLRQSGRIR